MARPAVRRCLPFQLEHPQTQMFMQSGNPAGSASRGHNRLPGCYHPRPPQFAELADNFVSLSDSLSRSLIAIHLCRLSAFPASRRCMVGRFSRIVLPCQASARAPHPPGPTLSRRNCQSIATAVNTAQPPHCDLEARPAPLHPCAVRAALVEERSAAVALPCGIVRSNIAADRSAWQCARQWVECVR